MGELRIEEQREKPSDQHAGNDAVLVAAFPPYPHNQRGRKDRSGKNDGPDDAGQRERGRVDGHEHDDHAGDEDRGGRQYLLLFFRKLLDAADDVVGDARSDHHERPGDCGHARGDGAGQDQGQGPVADEGVRQDEEQLVGLNGLEREPLRLRVEDACKTGREGQHVDATDHEYAQNESHASFTDVFRRRNAGQVMGHRHGAESHGEQHADVPFGAGVPQDREERGKGLEHVRRHVAVSPHREPPDAGAQGLGNGHDGEQQEGHAHETLKGLVPGHAVHAAERNIGDDDDPAEKQGGYVGNAEEQFKNVGNAFHLTDGIHDHDEDHENDRNQPGRVAVEARGDVSG